jgi:hypothetical protein
MVVDFRKLNERTVGDAHPLPDITEILDQLGQSKYFTCLDMAMGYHQIERFEQGTTTLTQLVKQQLVIVKSTLCTFNETLTDVEYNEVRMREGLGQLQKYIATFGSQVENTTYLFLIN